VSEIDPTTRTGGPTPLRCLYRTPEDDFFCLRYQLWYPSFDCAVRTRFQTANGCLECDQGRFNMKRHRQALIRNPHRLFIRD